MKYHNYAFFPSDFEDSDEFYYLYSNHYHTLANLFMKERKKIFEKVTSQTANCENKIEIIYYLLSSKNDIPKNFFNGKLKSIKKKNPSSVTSIGCSSLKKNRNSFFCN